MDDEEFSKLLVSIRQIAEAVVRHSHQLEELKHRVAQLESERRTNAIGVQAFKGAGDAL